MDHLVMVTGGSSGLGRALLDAAPADSVRIDISRSGHGGDGVRHLHADLADPATWAEVGRVIAQVVAEREWGRITFVHNAGTLTPIGFVGETDADAVTTNVLLNSASGQVLGHHVLQAMRELTCRRELVLISSGAGRRPVPGWATYGASKAAFDLWARTVGEEQAQRGGAVVLSVAPGVVDTPMQEEIRRTDPADFPEVERFRDLHASGSLADPDATAARMWELLDDPTLQTGSVIDLRDL
jgi:benzil reductase ((S)-benzoin forming)